jgi:hypothetical protein
VFGHPLGQERAQGSPAFKEEGSSLDVGLGLMHGVVMTPRIAQSRGRGQWQVAAVLVAMAGCASPSDTQDGGIDGGDRSTLCARLVGGNDRFFADGGTLCRVVNDAGSVMVQRVSQTVNVATCNLALNACSSDDVVVLDRYATCFDQAPVCTAGNEQAAVQGYGLCVSALHDAGSVVLSAGCFGP